MASFRDSREPKWGCGKPEACLALGACALLLGGSLHVSATIGREKTDEMGRVILDGSGEPVTEVDEWATFWFNWPSNLLGIGAGIWIIRGLVLSIRHSY